MNKPRRYARPLASVTTGILADAFKKQGFASAELVTRWSDIVGAEIAAHAEPIQIQWPRPEGDNAPEPGTLVLRVEGPAAIEIQHLSQASFWSGSTASSAGRRSGASASGRRRCAAASERRWRRSTRPGSPALPPSFPAIEDDDLKQALARLGAAIKGT